MSSWSTSALPTVEPPPVTTCSHSGRQPAVVDQQLGEGDPAERRLAGRLEHDRAAGGDGRRQLVGDEVEREVERADRPDDADRHAQREAELALAARRWRRAATMSPASVRASAAANWNVPTARSASTRAVLIGLAASRGDDARRTRRGARPAAGRRVSSTSARFQRGSGPAASAAFGRRHGPVDVGGAADRDPPDARRRRRATSTTVGLGAGEALAGQRDRIGRASELRRRWSRLMGATILPGRGDPLSAATPPVTSTGPGRSPSPIAAGPARPRRTPCRRSRTPSTSATATSRPTST